MSPTIQARAEAAANSICARFEPTFGEWVGREPDLAAIIARHFADLARLRAAAERAEKACTELVNAVALIEEAEDAISIDEGATDEQQDEVISAYHYQHYTHQEAKEALTALRAALTPDAAADGTKGT